MMKTTSKASKRAKRARKGGAADKMIARGMIVLCPISSCRQVVPKSMLSAHIQGHRADAK